MTTGKKASKPAPFTWARAIRDIVIRAMELGQMPFVALWLLAMAWVLSMPGTELAKIAVSLFERLASGEMWAYVLLLVLLVFWWLHVMALRKEYGRETHRIGNEKTKLQGTAAGTSFPSSQD